MNWEVVLGQDDELYRLENRILVCIYFSSLKIVTYRLYWRRLSPATRGNVAKSEAIVKNVGVERVGDSCSSNDDVSAQLWISSSIQFRNNSRRRQRQSRGRKKLKRPKRNGWKILKFSYFYLSTFFFELFHFLLFFISVEMSREDFPSSLPHLSISNLENINNFISQLSYF